MFYEFRQNNSGGSFRTDLVAGVSIFVSIEAIDYWHAVYKAERIGLYWDGVDRGYDCSCCGDRWSKPWSEDGTEEPTIYGEAISDPETWVFKTGDDDEPEGFIHHMDGRVEAVFTTSRRAGYGSTVSLAVIPWLNGREVRELNAA